MADAGEDYEEDMMVEEEEEEEEEEEQEDQDNEEEEDQDDDDEEEDEDPSIQLPDLDDVDDNGRPLRPRRYPPTPRNVPVPDYPTNDPPSILRRYLQDASFEHGVAVSHRKIEMTTECLMQIPGAMQRGKDEQGVRRFLFGWESIVWRKRHLPAAETRDFVKMLLMASASEINNIGPKLPTFQMREPTVQELDKFVYDILPILSAYVNRP